MHARQKAKEFIARMKAGERSQSYREKMESRLSQQPVISSSTKVTSLLSRFKTAMKRWRDEGYPVVGWSILYRRWRICSDCCHWSGLHCKHPDCGCTGIKLVLATEKCPIDKWNKEG